LRRRFFTPDSIRDREALRSHVVAALKGISTLDEQTSKEGKNAEDRFLRSYPFHPDLTEIFYITRPLMPKKLPPDPKTMALRQQRCLNPHPEF
jgi:hypothetical protein